MRPEVFPLRAIEPKWYCIHTRPQKEGRVSAYLSQNLALETYFPLLKEQKTIRRVKRTITGPLFSRYLFCRFDLGPHFRAVKYAPDVLDVVTFGAQPSVVPETLIEQLRSWAGVAVDADTLRPGLKLGDRVVINAGPFQGIEAVIHREQSDRERVAVMLSVLAGNEQKLLIDRCQVTRIA